MWKIFQNLVDEKAVKSNIGQIVITSALFPYKMAKLSLKSTRENLFHKLSRKIYYFAETQFSISFRKYIISIQLASMKYIYVCKENLFSKTLLHI